MLRLGLDQTVGDPYSENREGLPRRGAVEWAIAAVGMEPCRGLPRTGTAGSYIAAIRSAMSRKLCTLPVANIEDPAASMQQHPSDDLCHVIDEYMVPGLQPSVS